MKAQPFITQHEPEKTLKTMKNIIPTTARKSLILGGAALTCFAGSAAAATVATAGSDIDVSASAPDGGGYWRTAAAAKPNDIDGDNILGTDGFRYVTDNPGGNGLNDVVSSAPSYASLDNLVTNNFRGNGNYTNIDNPAGGILRSGTYNPVDAAISAEGSFISFGTIDFTSAAIAGQTVRIGLMVDNLDNIIFNSHFLRLSSDGLNFDVATTAESDLDNQNPDWYYWDVSDFAAGDQIEVFATSSEGNPQQTAFPATIGAFSFDSVVVPEPSTGSLIGLCALALATRRRR